MTKRCIILEPPQEKLRDALQALASNGYSLHTLFKQRAPGPAGSEDFISALENRLEEIEYDPECGDVFLCVGKNARISAAVAVLSYWADEITLLIYDDNDKSYREHKIGVAESC